MKALPRRLLVALVGLAIPGRPAAADPMRYLAFGDSITEGDDVYDTQKRGGYPGRLEDDYLNCTPAACEVVNRGLGGEKTAQGVTRIRTVLDSEGPFDVVLLMEGTNDLFAANPVANETIEANLAEMARKAENRGVEVVEASVIWFHPDGERGASRDDEVEDLRNRVSAQASDRERAFVDAWNILCPPGADQHGHSQATCFTPSPGHYSPVDPVDGDPVGHPNPSGFDMLAEAFHGPIAGSPVPGAPSPTGPAGDVAGSPAFTWTRESPVRASYYRVLVEGPSGTVWDAWYKADDDPNDGVGVCTGSACSIATPIALAAGDHTFTVQGRSLLGRGPLSAPLAFAFYTAPPAAVAVLSSPAGEQFEAAPKDFSYQWTAVADATAYRLQVLEGPTLRADVTVSDGAACAGGSCATLAGVALGQGSYTWKVQAQNPAGNAAFSGPLAFTVFSTAPQAAPVPGYPDREIFNPRPSHRWSPVAGSQDYVVEIFAGGDPGCAGEPGTPLASATFPAAACAGDVCAGVAATADLVPADDCWTVRGRNAFGDGPAATTAFTVLPCDPPETREVDGLAVGPLTEAACVELDAGQAGCTARYDILAGPVTLHAGQRIALRCLSLKLGASLQTRVDP